MTIKDFKVGQTAHIMGDGCTQRNRFTTRVAEVTKIGRKYVTVKTSGGWDMKFKETCDDRPFLTEHTECGASRLLFPSSEAVDEYREREELKTWVRSAAGWEKIDCYTLAQLRAVKKILEGADHDC